MPLDEGGRMEIYMKQKKFDFIYLIPSVVGILLFYVLPFGVVIFYSLVNNPIQKEFVGLGNYADILQNRAFQIAIKNTLFFMAAAVPLSLLFSLALALLLEVKIPLRSQFRLAILSPMMVPVASVVLVWRIFFNLHGVCNQLLSMLSVEGVDWLKSDYGMWVFVFLFLWKNVGYNMILFIAGLGTVPKDSVDVARVEGASNWQIFWQVKLRYLSPTIFFVTLLSLIHSFQIFREVYTLTGDYPYNTVYLLQHFINNTFRTLDYQKMSTAAIVISLGMIVLIGILFVLEHWFGKDLEG